MYWFYSLRRVHPNRYSWLPLHYYVGDETNSDEGGTDLGSVSKSHMYYALVDITTVNITSHCIRWIYSRRSCKDIHERTCGLDKNATNSFKHGKLGARDSR